MRANDTEWLLEHSEMTDANPLFVWQYWTDVTHWVDPPASFSLDGPFRAGSCGETIFPDREPLRWTLEEVHAGVSYTIASDLDGAVLLFQWRFDPAAGGGTKLAQRIGLSGPGSASHAEGVRSAFASTLGAGMKRIAILLSEAQARSEGAAQQGDAPDKVRAGNENRGPCR